MAYAKNSRFFRLAALAHLQTRTRIRTPLVQVLRIAKTRYLWALTHAQAPPHSAEARRMTSGTYHTRDLTNFHLHLLQAIIRLSSAPILLHLRTSCRDAIEAQRWLPLPFAVHAPAIAGAIPSIPATTQPRKDPGTTMTILALCRLPREPTRTEVAGTRLGTTTVTEPTKKTEVELEGAGP